MLIDLGLIAFTLTLWTAIGFLGQIFFSMRFILQWLSSEKARKSVMPVAFWYFSILGGATLLAYAIHQEDPVFIFGQALGLIIYVRNLVLIRKEKQNAVMAAE
ncbi:lipid-A-disaccharide synthase N-terminal domain-containing protein [Rhodospirillum rubrum]|uniref:Lipid A biosynthesis-like n=1 Tax=Rhodospirillum rubrum (strain ATCC 11170 / ATH 1.1.1 / DSM 467 / LMG 4362 / NCIMB 8255 / S1) TaxID=269796 RepID=Q2RT22_RHORT|nr:lipid-A-disaccharide synthase N-terminal domain-containing protein [Rhodospirillum rubrum]ABC22723.1 Lipid A biosynthesis-like [Rhodospirillum rubrum ATCC 11170]AEO48443.1 Lipid A biosynthesis-like protein [Rhodospirillum rubrum F11]MBK5954322.1 lipid A biosynthesis protein [Rhodospirillum rubrum]QXG78715.1 lipid-A-disaccharide synthase N-terminal domain-containing protein [Rhodospirillum rubrum]HAP98746.1 lipid A biosynthesis protein [Rhodospirillum rubrum]